MSAASPPTYRTIFPANPLTCSVVLDDPVLRPPQSIIGEVIVTNPESIPVDYHGLIVQLEAVLQTQYEVGSPLGRSIYFTSESLWKLGGSKEFTGPIRRNAVHYRHGPSPVRQEFVSHSRQIRSIGEASRFTLDPGDTVSCPFRLEFPFNVHGLPAPFSDKCGKLAYVVAAYWRQYERNHEFGAEVVMGFEGYNSLREDVRLLPPLEHQSGFKKSFLSTLKVKHGERGGFLAGESVEFMLTIKNPRSFRIHEIKLVFLKKLRFMYQNGGNIMKKVTTVVGESILHRGSSNFAVRIVENGSFKIPEDAGVSYTGNKYYEVTFCLQYEVKLAEFGKPLEGFVDINIGSERLDGNDRRGSSLEINRGVVSLAQPRRSADLPAVLPELRRRTFVPGRCNRRNSTAGVPEELLPSYFQLFPRSNSMETLPPHYDDLRAD